MREYLGPLDVPRVHDRDLELRYTCCQTTGRGSVLEKSDTASP